MSGDLYIFFCCDKPDGDEKQLYDNLMKIKKEGSSEDIDQTHFGKDNWHLAIKIVSPGKVTSVVDSFPLELIYFKNKKIFGNQKKDKIIKDPNITSSLKLTSVSEEEKKEENKEENEGNKQIRQPREKENMTIEEIMDNYEIISRYDDPTQKITNLLFLKQANSGSQNGGAEITDITHYSIFSHFGKDGSKREVEYWSIPTDMSDDNDEVKKFADKSIERIKEFKKDEEKFKKEKLNLKKTQRLKVWKPLILQMVYF